MGTCENSVSILSFVRYFKANPTKFLFQKEPETFRFIALPHRSDVNFPDVTQDDILLLGKTPG